MIIDKLIYFILIKYINGRGIYPKDREPSERNARKEQNEKLQTRTYGVYNRSGKWHI